MSYSASNDVFDAIRGQIEQQLAEELDSVIIFDGDLSVAIEQRMNEAGLGDTTVFIGMPETTYDQRDGCGLPLREQIGVDIYIVVRAKGRTRYTTDRERLWDISDRLVHDVFTCANRDSDFTAVIHGWLFERRVRMQTDPELMAHKIEFSAKPVR